MTGLHGFQYGGMECSDTSAGIGRGGGLILLRPLHPEMANLAVVGGFLLGLPGAAETGFPAAPGSGVFSCECGACGLAMDRFPVAPQRFSTMAFLSGSFPSGW